MNPKKAVYPKMSESSRNNLREGLRRLEETQITHIIRIATNEIIREMDNPSGTPNLEIKVAVHGILSVKPPCS